jgi:hypothetical protein
MKFSGKNMVRGRNSGECILTGNTNWIFVFPVFFGNILQSQNGGEEMIIVTNNDDVRDMAGQDYKVQFEETDYLGILKICRDMIHKGYELLTHPLYGSVKPNETPYRSIALKENDILSMDSVTMIEDAISTAIKFQGNKSTPDWNDSVLDDFKVIDLDIFTNTIQRMQYED